VCLIYTSLKTLPFSIHLDSKRAWDLLIRFYWNRNKRNLGLDVQQIQLFVSSHLLFQHDRDCDVQLEIAVSLHQHHSLEARSPELALKNTCQCKRSLQPTSNNAGKGPCLSHHE
jgi:hypothetical protein